MSSIYDNYPAVRYVDEYDKDTDEQCVRCKGNCGLIGITGMWACKGFVPMTNADRIRSMNDEELATVLYAGCRGRECPEGMWDNPLTEDEEDSLCLKCTIAWLKGPVGEAQNGT